MTRRRVFAATGGGGSVTLDLVVAMNNRDGGSLGNVPFGGVGMPAADYSEFLSYYSSIYNYVGAGQEEIDNDDGFLWYLLHTHMAGFEFQASIPQGSTIDTAKIGVTALSSDDEGVANDTVCVYAYLGDAAVFNSAHAHDLLAHQSTTTYIGWVLPSMSANTIYWSPNIASIVQTVISGTWSSGNYLGIVFAPNLLWDTVTGDTPSFYDYNCGNPTYYARLHVVYH
jgi:hypothetical protein